MEERKSELRMPSPCERNTKKEKIKIPIGFFNAAETLFSCGFSIDYIATTLKISVRRLYRWQKKGNWKERYENKTAKINDSEAIALSITHEQLKNLEAASKQGNFTAKETDMLLKLSKNIREARIKDRVSCAIIGISDFSEWLEKQDFETVQILVPFMQKYLTEKTGK